MVRSLCQRLTRHGGWALVGGLLFVVYSHSVFAVAWLAAQNAILQTVLTLGALLCYLTASGLGRGVRALADPSTPAGSLDAPGRDGAGPNLGRGAFAGSVALLVLALLSRENAVVFPVIALCADLSFGGLRHVRRRWGAHLVFLAVVAVYLYWRLAVVHHPIPDVYIRRPDGEGYLLWCLAKLMHYVTSSVWLSPMTIGPTGRFHPFAEVPADCLLMLLILAVLAAGYWSACRYARGFWLWPLWIVLSVLPVVPVLATPHTGYMAGVGFAVALVLGPGLRDRIRGRSIGRWPNVVAIWFLIATTTYVPIYRMLWDGVRAAEQLTVSRMLSSPPPPEATDVFLINVPFVNIYAGVQWAQSMDRGESPPRFHALTFSPSLLEMNQPCTVEQLDAHRLRVAVMGRAYFSGLLGRFLIDGMRRTGRFTPGQRIGGEEFDVEIVAADAHGVQELVFTFDEPVASRRYRFYVSTPACAAARLKLWDPNEVDEPLSIPRHTVSLAAIDRAAAALEAGRAEAAGTLLAAVQGAQPQFRERAGRVLLPIARRLAAATASPIADQLESNRIQDTDWGRVAEWWQRSVDDRMIVDLWINRGEGRALRTRLDRFNGIRRRAASIIKTDLYLSGPPYPGPR